MRLIIQPIRLLGEDPSGSTIHPISAAKTPTTSVRVDAEHSAHNREVEDSNS
jgi:hypothetical protein